MKRYSILAIAVLIVSGVLGQEYKVAKNSGRLLIREVNNVTIEGYDGNEVVFTSLAGDRDRDPRSAGLRAIGGNGVEDNTGLGLSVVENASTLEVMQLKKMDGPKVKIRVPKGVSVVYSHTSPHGSDLKVVNFAGELEVSTVHNGIRLENVSGPVRVKTVHGDVDADFSNGVKEPLYLFSTHGAIDLTIPAALKADVSLSTTHGEMFVDPALKLDIPKGEWNRYSADKVEGKLNGGGVEVTLGTSHGSIYLRKK